tara:strand:+ start:195 stop:341 length:147 start_codon:yes stop_codon:yes gene_type:complete
LRDYQYTANKGVYVVHPDNQFMPLMARLFIDQYLNIMHDKFWQLPVGL